MWVRILRLERRSSGSFPVKIQFHNTESFSVRLLRRRHQSGVHRGGALCAATPLPSDLRHLPEAPPGRLLHRRRQLRLRGGHEEDDAGRTPPRRHAGQTAVGRSSAAAGRRPARRPGGSAEAVSSRRAGREEEEGAR